MLLPSILAEVLIEQIRVRGLQCVSCRSSIAIALQTLLSAPADPLGVLQDDQVLGVVTSQTIVQALASGAVDRQSSVAKIYQPVAPITLEQLTDLAALLRQRDLLRQCPLPVIDDQGQAIGLLLADDLRQLFSPETLLGRVRVRDVSLSPGLEVSPETSVQALAQKMGLPRVVVSTANRAPLGWVTPADVLRVMSAQSGWEQMTAADLLTPLPGTLALDDSLQVACDRMATAPLMVVTTAQGQFCGVLLRSQVQTLWDPHEYLQSRYSLEQTVLEQTLELCQLSYHQRQLRQTLARSESRYQAIVENAPVGINQADTSGQFIQVNRQFCELLGYTEAELLEKRHQEVTHPDDLGKYTQDIRRMAAGEAPFLVLEKRYLHKDGTPVWVQVTLSCLRELDGSIASDLAIVEDIRERKQAETERQRIEVERQQAATQQRLYLQELATWRRRYEMGGQASGQVLFEFDIVANRDLWGPNTEEMFGYRAEEMPQGVVEFAELVHPDDRPAFQKVVDDDAHAKSAYRVEYRFRCRDGTYKWVEERGQTFYSEPHEPLYVIGVIVDVCDRKQAELDLTRAKEAADAANRAKSAFLANMSHELRTPLNIILGFTQVLQQDPNLTLFYQETLSTILQSGDHLLSLINDVLHVAKIEANQVTLHPQKLHLIPFLSALEKMLQGQAATKGLQLQLEIAPDLPACIEVDQCKLRQILINLLGNAIKFTQSGWVKLRCSCSPLPLAFSSNSLDPSWLRFEIIDTGIGMAEPDLKNIFEPFSQISHQPALSEGTGLGLTISRRYTELMGGHIMVQSQLGQGSVFALEIPVRCLPTQWAPMPTPDSIVKILRGQVVRRTLIVDDVPTNRKVLAKLLSPLQWPVREAANGQEAVDIWQQWRPELVWMDLRMPVVDGYEAIRRIRQLEQAMAQSREEPLNRTCIIVLTAGTLEDETAQSLAAGSDDIVLKPLSRQRLFHLLGKHLCLNYTYEQSQIHPVSQTALADLLPQQSPDWLQALHYAALCCDDSQVRQLLQNLPLEGLAIAHLLQPLLYEFRFDSIVELLRPFLKAAS
ncbi:MAG: PAS domain S-box protein [Cyanobacteria bacterium Co-bin8]|nr:PAS domain S-box protein [Cyanobacteria bacterium Co-bin8]